MLSEKSKTPGKTSSRILRGKSPVLPNGRWLLCHRTLLGNFKQGNTTARIGSQKHSFLVVLRVEGVDEKGIRKSANAFLLSYHGHKTNCRKMWLKEPSLVS